MLTTTEVARRAQLRDQLTDEVNYAKRQLVDRHGFEQYRQDELLHRKTGRHIRATFASNEWRLVVSDMPEGGYGGVARMAWIPRGQIVLDVRNYERNQSMPTGEEIIALVQQ